MTIKETLKKATELLSGEGIPEPKASAEVLLSDILNCSRTELLTRSDHDVEVRDQKKFHRFLKRRLKHEPVWQIIGKVQFWGMDYLVDKNVLVPRPETEILVTEVLDLISKDEKLISKRDLGAKRVTRNSKLKTQKLKILDLGTGSGTIIIALASELAFAGSKYFIPNTEYGFYASDISSKALKIAKKNTTKLLNSSLVVFKRGDLFGPWKGKRFDVVCANLPYIPHEDMGTLAFDVLHHEPRVALDGGAGGAEIYERFFATVGDFLEPNGTVFCEIGINQGELIKKIVKKYQPDFSVRIIGDLAGIDRIAIINS